MKATAKFLLATASSFSLYMFSSMFELRFLNPVQVVVLALIFVALVSGLVAGSTAGAGFGTLLGGFIALILSVFLGIEVWNPSPSPSDLIIIRILLVGFSSLLSAGVGYVAAGITHKGVQEAQSIFEEEKKTEAAEVSVEKSIESPQAPAEAELRICKFCGNAIPAESIYCPMCGEKLVET